MAAAQIEHWSCIRLRCFSAGLSTELSNYIIRKTRNVLRISAGFLKHLFFPLQKRSVIGIFLDFRRDFEF
jgi:hypothetical protein